MYRKVMGLILGTANYLELRIGVALYHLSIHLPWMYRIVTVIASLMLQAVTVNRTLQTFLVVMHRYESMLSKKH